MPSIAQPDNGTFETTFADLSHAQLRDKAPALLDYLLGFQTMDVNEDQTHAIGVLGFKVGEQMIYVPSFFLNGELKMNLMYMKDQDLFAPLQDNWVSYLLNRRPIALGKKEPKREAELGVMPPDFSQLSNTTSGAPAAALFGTRMASWQPWAQGIVGMFASIGSRPRGNTLPEFLQKTASHRTMLPLLRSMREDLAFANKVVEFYDLSQLAPKQAAESCCKPKNKPDKRILPKTRSPLIHDVAKRAADNGPDKVRILTVKDASSLALTDVEREKLLRGEPLIKDAREVANTAYRTDQDVNLFNPTAPGRYELLLRNGEFIEAYISPAPKTVGPGHSRTALVVALDDGKAFNYYWPQTLWCKPYETTLEDERKWINGLDNASGMQPNSIYTILDDNGRGTVAFRVSRKSTTKDGATELWVEPRRRNCEQRPGIAARRDETELPGGGGRGSQHDAMVTNSTWSTWGGDPGPSSPEDWDAPNHIVLVTDGRGIRIVGKTLFAPADAKVLKLKSERGEQTWGLADPSSMVDFELNLLKSGAHQLTLLKKAEGTYVDEAGPYNKLQLLTHLVKNAGLRGDAALTIVDSLRDGKRSRFLVKNAVGYAPGMPEPPMGFNEYAGVNEQYPMDVMQPVDSDVNQNLQAYLGKPEKQMLMDAAQTGQQDVFDTSAIASLVRTSNSDDLIGQYLSDIILGLDRVARILFLFYWMNENFRDRYGQENMVELEDHLKSVVKSLGDLILFLKQRQVQGSPAYDALEIDLGKSSQGK